MTPLKAIRLKCLNCCCDSYKAIEDCPCGPSNERPEAICILFPFRFGKRPNTTKRIFTPEQKAGMLSRMGKSRLKKQPQ